MSYTVFALKWRPKNFDEITGQSHIVNQLKSAIQKDRLAHAYLFSGPRGVGKTSTARILAKALNCQAGPTAEPCGKCPACLDIAGGRSLDVIEIDGASNRGIDEIRTLRENVKFSPANGKFKVYIIDEVHQITSDGFNALLKTLEEPPEFVKFIFATTQPNKVPATILSRCQRLDFRRISVMEIIAQLEKIISSEKVKVDKDVLFAVARASEGSLRDAESILDQLVVFAKEKVSLEDVVSMLGMVETNTLFEITDCIIRKDPGEALELLNKIVDNGKDANTFLADMIEHFRNLMVAKVSRENSRLIDLPADVCQKLLEQAKALSLEEIFNCFSVLVNTQETAKRMESLRIPLEVSLVRLSIVKPAVPGSLTTNPAPKEKFSSAPRPGVEPHSSTPGVGKGSVGMGNSPQAKNKPAAAPVKKEELQKFSPTPVVGNQVKAAAENKNPVSFEQIVKLWHEIVKNTSNLKISIGHYLKEGTPVKLLGNTLTVSFHKNRSLYKESLEAMENRMMVERIVKQIMNAEIKLNFVLSQENKSDEVTLTHPTLQAAMDTFNARLIKEEQHG
ncbi:MAG: DNA polymerase III subunit gamma/tau [Candidatus Omnitrophica bacterium]|nr:DNA polymerase III subunit gamma/tau [Candidatus Omnitrophota bacterium]